VTGGQWGGRTALATLALVVAGESPTDPRIAEATKMLVPADLKGIYALGLRDQLLALLNQNPEVRLSERRDCQLLLDNLGKKGISKGFYGYAILKGG
jgi:hypothetical protein